MSEVPCNGCTLCCRKDAVRLLPADDPSEFKTEPHPYWPGEVMLAHKPNGDCIYLEPGGCSIHDRRPQMCREMDCRNVARAIGYTQARKMDKQGKLNIMLWHKGRSLERAAK